MARHVLADDHRVQRCLAAEVAADQNKIAAARRIDALVFVASRFPLSGM
jgi:hypothetical protein